MSKYLPIYRIYIGKIKMSIYVWLSIFSFLDTCTLQGLKHENRVTQGSQHLSHGQMILPIAFRYDEFQWTSYDPGCFWSIQDWFKSFVSPRQGLLPHLIPLLSIVILHKSGAQSFFNCATINLQSPGIQESFAIFTWKLSSLIIEFHSY